MGDGRASVVPAHYSWATTVAVFLMIATVFFGATNQLNAVRVGDGSEYYAMEIAVSQTHRPYMTEPAWQGYDLLQRSASIERMGADRANLQEKFPELRVGNTADFNHFWFYSALAAASQGVLAFMQLPASGHQGFLLLHALLCAWALAAALRWFGWTGLLAAAIILFGSPALWFVDKVHTEWFTICLTLVATAAAMRARWALSGAILALASTQNISFAIPAFVACLFALPINREQRRQFNLRQAALLTVAFFAALLHPLYYWMRYGGVTPQLIGRGANVDKASLSKGLNFIFDLDIGLLPNWPLGVAVALALLVGLGARIRKGRVDKAPIFSQMAALGLVYLLAALYAQSATTTINSGATVNVARYGLWYLCLFFPAVLAVLVWARKSYSRLGGIVLLVLPLLVLNWIQYSPGKKANYLSPSPVAAFVYSNFPAAIKPNKQIFMGRNSGLRGGASPGPASITLGPGCHMALVRPGPGDMVLTGRDTCFLSAARLTRLLEVRGEIGQVDHYVVLSKEDIKDARSEIMPIGEHPQSVPLSSVIREGWSRLEPWGVWTDEAHSSLLLLVDPEMAQSLEVTLQVKAFSIAGPVRRNISVSLNDVLQQRVTLSDRMPHDLIIHVPAEVARQEDGYIRIALDQPLPQSPVQLGRGTESRHIGVGLLSVKVRRVFDDD